MEEENKNYVCLPYNFINGLNQVGISKLGYQLILWMGIKTSKRWIRDKSSESNPLDWIDLNFRQINRECWGKNSTQEIRRALGKLGAMEIIVYNSNIDKIRINYKPETWSIY